MGKKSFGGLAVLALSTALLDVATRLTGDDQAIVTEAAARLAEPTEALAAPTYEPRLYLDSKAHLMRGDTLVELKGGQFVDRLVDKKGKAFTLTPDERDQLTAEHVIRYATVDEMAADAATHAVATLDDAGSGDGKE